MPRWAASMRLPKPTIVVSPFTKTAMMVERATSGPPWSRPSMKRMTILSPNSAAAPRISGIPNTLPRLSLTSKSHMRPAVHVMPSASGDSASTVSRMRRSIRKVSTVTSTMAYTVPCLYARSMSRIAS